MSVSEFSRQKSLTPLGEAASERFENKVKEAVEEAIAEGLCWGMIVAVLHQAVHWMHRRIDEE
ncbi:MULTISPECIES: hypothetical protein [unclassified Halomonas]|uniref:hypothetical protein n=1 Tax=unclassified Halomonas TaxID=2609666 RepID=UPI001CF2B703|nr:MULTISPECIES: hypothetical protein [unclassified Halomonas]MCA8865298.1 hypothetical protein [Halomonas sp. SBBP1]UZH12261.1 hypothetical protein OM794_11230 [Halomonas sp. BDJS001]